jgi:hypothetical protein
MFRARRFLVIVAIASALVLSACASAVTPAPTPSPTPIPGIAAPVNVAGGQILIESVTYEPKGFGPMSGADSWLGVIGKVVSGSPDFSQLGSAVTLTSDGTVCRHVASGSEAPFWVFMVKTSMHSFVLHLPGGHDIPLDSILPAR